MHPGILQVSNKTHTDHSDTGIKAEKAIGNFTAGFTAASAFLAHPFDELGKWDLYPKESLVPPDEQFEASWPKDLPDVNLDFNGMPATYRMIGAYSGVGKNPGRIPLLKPRPLDFSRDVPSAPSKVRID